jgi:hypothetical protein
VNQSFRIFPAPSVMAVIILDRSSQSYPGMASTSQGCFGVIKVRLPTLVVTLDLVANFKILY